MAKYLISVNAFFCIESEGMTQANGYTAEGIASAVAFSGQLVPKIQFNGVDIAPGLEIGGVTITEVGILPFKARVGSRDTENPDIQFWN